LRFRGQMMTKLPFKLSAQTKGAQKAHSAMVEQYGKEKGEEIFLKKADEQGTGTTIRQKVNSIYKTGAKIGRRS
jgi:hypothetical protein